MSIDSFRQQISELTDQIFAMPLDDKLENWLNAQHGKQSETFQELKTACLTGIDEGWLCNHEAGGIRYGRVFKPASDLHEFSVDVVDMKDVVGPFHSHPVGEIDLVMPMDDGALFDGIDAGWKVYAPQSSHHPRVSNGRALILYLLPQGQIDFNQPA